MAGWGDRIGRWLRQSPSGQWVGATLGACYMRLVNLTTRWQVEGREAFATLVAGSTGVIAITWHGRLFMSPFWALRGSHAVAVISANRDGDLISALVRKFGVIAVRGSTYDRAKGRDKGGAQAFAGALEALTDHGALVAITPDGPRGPRMQAARGVALLAIQTGAPVQPIAFSVTRGKVLRNWDRFLVPWPFGRGVQLFGDALWPPQAEADDTEIDDFLARITTAQTALQHRADDLCQRPRVTPADSPVDPPADPRP